MNLVLVGYRGSGKTTVGGILARRLGWVFVDLDRIIAENAGKSISGIFAEEGEAGFRSREREACLRLRKSGRQVVATGGGVVADPDTHALLRRLGKVVWLRAPAAILWSRISADLASPSDRPDLTPAGGLAEVETLLAQREPLYESAAHHTIETFPNTPEDVADAIELWYEANDSARSK